MTEMPGTEYLPGNSIDAALPRLEQAAFHLSVVQKGKIWLVRVGELCVLRSDNRETVDAFLLGATLVGVTLDDEAIAIQRRKYGLDP